MFAADDDDDPPIGTVHITRNSRHYYHGGGDWGFDPPEKEQPKKGEKAMSIKKNILWFGVIVAVISVVIWLYKKLTAGAPEDSGPSI